MKIRRVKKMYIFLHIMKKLIFIVKVLNLLVFKYIKINVSPIIMFLVLFYIFLGPP